MFQDLFDPAISETLDKIFHDTTNTVSPVLAGHIAAELIRLGEIRRKQGVEVAKALGLAMQKCPFENMNFIIWRMRMLVNVDNELCPLIKVYASLCSALNRERQPHPKFTSDEKIKAANNTCSQNQLKILEEVNRICEKREDKEVLNLVMMLLVDACFSPHKKVADTALNLINQYSYLLASSKSLAKELIEFRVKIGFDELKEKSSVKKNIYQRINQAVAHGIIKACGAEEIATTLLAIITKADKDVVDFSSGFTMAVQDLLTETNQKKAG